MTNPDTETFANPYAHVLWECPSGNFSYATPSNGSRTTKARISFSWLMFQGTEFRIEFADQQSKELAARAIFDRFAPETEKAVLKIIDVDAFIRSGAYDGPKYAKEYMRHEDVERRQKMATQGEFMTKTETILPHMVVDLLPADARIIVAPTSHKAREQLLKVGIDVFHREQVDYAPDMLPEPTLVARLSLIHLDGDVRIEDRGELGVCLSFRHDDTPASKWFVDAAAEQIRTHRRDQDWLNAFVEEHVEVGMVDAYDDAVGSNPRF